MKKEKHYLNRVYGGHQLSRYIDVYEVTTNGCSSSPMSGYKGTEATLVDQPAWNEKFSSYSITGATLTGNNFILNNDVTAQANYETAKNLTLQTDGHGTIASTKSSGFINDTATLSNTASSGYGFSGYSITGATLTGSNFKFTGSNITAKAWFSAVPYYTALYFNDGTPFQGATAFTGSYLTAGNNPLIDYFQPVTRVTKSYTVSRNLIAMSWDGTAVNLEFTGNIFAYPSPVKYNDFYGMKDKYTTYREISDGLRHDVTAGYMKLSASESAFITAVYIDVTGVTDNANGTVNNLKIKFNGQTLNSTGSMINNTGSIHTLINGSPGKVVLSSPIVITSNNQKLTFYVTGTAPSTWHTVSNIQPNSAVWYGYISGLHS